MLDRFVASTLSRSLTDRTQKAELLRLCARIGYTPPGVLQHAF